MELFDSKGMKSFRRSRVSAPAFPLGAVVWISGRGLSGPLAGIVQDHSYAPGVSAPRYVCRIVDVRTHKDAGRPPYTCLKKHLRPVREFWHHSLLSTGKAD